jgi:hypothetical protein
MKNVLVFAAVLAAALPAAAGVSRARGVASPSNAGVAPFRLEPRAVDATRTQRAAPRPGEAVHLGSGGVVAVLEVDESQGTRRGPAGLVIAPADETPERTQKKVAPRGVVVLDDMTGSTAGNGKNGTVQSKSTK